MPIARCYVALKAAVISLAAVARMAHAGYVKVCTCLHRLVSVPLGLFCPLCKWVKPNVMRLVGI